MSKHDDQALIADRLKKAETALVTAWGHLNDEKYLHSDRERILMIRTAIVDVTLAVIAERESA